MDIFCISISFTTFLREISTENFTTSQIPIKQLKNDKNKPKNPPNTLSAFLVSTKSETEHMNFLSLKSVDE